MNNNDNNAERQKRFREELRRNGMKVLYVRGSGGEFDERIRIALGVQKLAAEGALPPAVLDVIIKAAVDVIPPVDRVNELFIRKLLNNYLSGESDEKHKDF